MPPVLLLFRHLENREFILNAKVHLDNGYVISVSKNDPVHENHPNWWAVGDNNDYEIAIFVHGDMAFIPEFLGNSNIKNHVTNVELERIYEKLSKLPAPCHPVQIQVFDTDGKSEPAWHTRFTSEYGTKDFEEKSAYVHRVWGKKVQYVGIPEEAQEKTP